MIAGTHGSTYGGNPLGCAVGKAVVDTIADPAFLEDVRRKSAAFRQRLEGLVAAHPEVFDGVRGQGLILGLHCVAPAADIVKAGYAEDLLTVPAADNVLRIIPALNISEDELAEAVARLDRAATRVKANAT
jgi:acetylornithine/N-succinyldiaminopimelate aminotransferase